MGFQSLLVCLIFLRVGPVQYGITGRFSESHEISHTRLLPMTVTQEMPTVAGSNHQLVLKYIRTNENA